MNIMASLNATLASMSYLEFSLAFITTLTVWMLFMIWLVKEWEEGCGPICQLCCLFELPAEWISNFIERRKTASSTPSPELPPSERAGDTGMGADVAAGLGVHKSGPTFQKIRMRIPLARNNSTAARIKFNREDGGIVAEAITDHGCLLRAFLPFESNGGDLNGEHPHVRDLDATDETGRWCLDGLDITLNKPNFDLPLIDVRFHPNKSDAQVNAITPERQEQAKKTGHAAEQCGTGGQHHDVNFHVASLAGCVGRTSQPTARAGDTNTGAAA